MLKKLSAIVQFVVMMCVFAPQHSYSQNPEIFIENLYQPMAAVGKPYSYQLETFGSGSFTWTVDSGNLPAGLQLDSSGLISGTPTDKGFSTFTVKATRTDGAVDTRQFTMTVYQENALVEGFVNVPYVHYTDEVLYSIASDNAGYLYAAGKAKSYPGGERTLLKRYFASSGVEDSSITYPDFGEVLYSVAADQNGNVYVATTGGGFVINNTGGIPCFIDDGAWNAVAVGERSGNVQTFYLANNTFIRKYGMNLSGGGCSMEWQYEDWSEVPVFGKRMGLAVDWDGNVYASYTKNIVKLLSNGAYAWKIPFEEGTPADIAVDHYGYLYVTGTETFGNNETRYVTAKYTQNGQPLWRNKFRHKGGDHSANAIAIYGNHVYVAGTVGYAHVSAFEYQHSDVLTIMYDLSGNWNGTKVLDYDTNDEANGIAIDSLGNLYVAGSSLGYWSDAADTLIAHYYPLQPDSTCNLDSDLVTDLNISATIGGLSVSSTSVGNKVLLTADVNNTGCQPEYSFQTLRLGPNGQDNNYNYLGEFTWYPSINMKWDTTGYTTGTYRIRVFARNSNGLGRYTVKSWIVDNFELTAGSTAPKPDVTPSCDENLSAVTQLNVSFEVNNHQAASATVGDKVVMRADTVGSGCGVEYAFRTTRLSPGPSDNTFYSQGGGTWTVYDSISWDTKDYLPGTYKVVVYARNGNGDLRWGQNEKSLTSYFTLSGQ